MLDDSQFLKSVDADAPELFEAATTLLEFADVFDGAEVSSGNDDVACLSIDFSLPYPDEEKPEPGESWMAAVYVDEVEVWHLGACTSGVNIVTAMERMPLTEFVTLLRKLRERLVGDQAC